MAGARLETRRYVLRREWHVGRQRPAVPNSLKEPGRGKAGDRRQLDGGAPVAPPFALK